MIIRFSQQVSCYCCYSMKKVADALPCPFLSKIQSFHHVSRISLPFPTKTGLINPS